MSKSLIRLFDYHERSFDLLKLALNKELRSTGDPATLFREDKMSFRIISNYLKLVGAEWLKHTIAPTIQHLYTLKEVSFEIGESIKPSQKSKNLKRLTKLTQSFTESIFKSANLIPG